VTWWQLVLVGALLIVAGCTHPLEAAIVSANGAAAGLKATHAAIHTASVSAQRDAARRVVGDRSNPAVRAEQLDRARQAGAKYRPAWDAYAAAREIWLLVADAINEAKAAEAAGLEPDLQMVAAMLAVLANAQKELEQVAGTMINVADVQNGLAEVLR